MWLFGFKLLKIKQNQKLSFSVILATFQVLKSHSRLVAIASDWEDAEHFHHCRKFYWIALERKDKDTTHHHPVRNVHQSGFVSRPPSLKHPVTHTPILPINRRSSESLVMLEKREMGVYFDAEMQKFRPWDLTGGLPDFPISSTTSSYSLHSSGSNYPDLNVSDEKFLTSKMISFWKLFCKGLPVFMHF